MYSIWEFAPLPVSRLVALRKRGGMDLANGAHDRPACLITGGARRIGAAFACRLALRFDIALHSHNSTDEARALADELRATGARVECLHANFAEPESAGALVQAAADAFGRLDLVLNSASAFEYDDPSDFSAGTMQRLLAVNLVAPLGIAREFARVGSRDATLINMLDSKVVAPNPDFFSYSLGKFALQSAGDMLAMRFAGTMRVNAIAPSNTLISGDQSRDNFEKAWSHTLTGAGPTLDELCDAVEFIWDTKSLNGQVLVLDGGQRLMSLPRDVSFLVE